MGARRQAVMLETLPMFVSGGGTPEHLGWSAGEVAHGRAFCAAIERARRARKLPPNPGLLYRVEEVLSMYWLAKRIERRVWSDLANAEPESDARPAGVHPCLEPLGKAWERYRKAMRELEAFLGVQPATRPAGLPGAAQPILKRTEGVLEESLDSGDASDRGSGDDA